MKEIMAAVVSCYYINNYGSVLQAYATQRVLDKLGVENKTINVTGFIKEIRKRQILYILKEGISSDIFKDKLGKAKRLIIKKVVKSSYVNDLFLRDNAMRDFANRYIRLSDKVNTIDDLNKWCLESVDIVLLGSDQLWLPSNIAADYFTLSFVPEKIKKITYATSFGVTDIPDNLSEKARIFLNRINSISVREYDGQRIVEKMTGKKPPVVCDPTLLLCREDWEEILSDNRKNINEEYIFCYFIGNSINGRDFAKRLKKYTNTKIVALIHLDCYQKNDVGYADITPFDIGPEGFISLIKNAKYVCTDSFHCSVFSILFHKEFFVFRRYQKETSQSTNGRLDSLMSSLGISERIISGKEKVSVLLDQALDYSRIDNNLMMLKNESLDYLISSIHVDL